MTFKSGTCASRSFGVKNSGASRKNSGAHKRRSGFRGVSELKTPARHGKTPAHHRQTPAHRSGAGGWCTPLTALRSVGFSTRGRCLGLQPDRASRYVIKAEKQRKDRYIFSTHNFRPNPRASKTPKLLIQNFDTELPGFFRTGILSSQSYVHKRCGFVYSSCSGHCCGSAQRYAGW